MPTLGSAAGERQRIARIRAEREKWERKRIAKWRAMQARSRYVPRPEPTDA